MLIWKCNILWIWHTNENLPAHQRNIQSSMMLMNYYTCSLNKFWALSIDFQLAEIETVLIQVNHLVLRKELIWELKDSINPSICVTLHSLDKNWPLVWLLMIHFTFPRIFCIIYCCIVSTLHHSQEFVAEIKPLQSNSAFFFSSLFGSYISKWLT